MIIVGNVPPLSSILRANVIIGTPNELGGVLHKDATLIAQMNTQLRAIVMDEVDDYTTAPTLFASKWNLKRRRTIYNEKKMTLSGRLGDFNTGLIEWFVKRSLHYSRRKDLQVLAASATLTRRMARKVYRLLRWDPLGRWYNAPPPLLRPLAMMQADWQTIPRMPTVPLHVDHRFVPVIKARTTTQINETHWIRKPFSNGGLPRLKVKSNCGPRKAIFGEGGRPVLPETAANMLDGLHDALKSREPGSSMLLICRTVGVTVRDTVSQLHRWGFVEAESMHQALWGKQKSWFERWSVQYTYDQKDHAAELAQRHRELSNRLRTGIPREIPVGSPHWKMLQERAKRGETTSPIVVGFEGMGRGIHFDGVDTVYILGLPRKPEVYLHLAGRVGRPGQTGAKVVSIVPKRSGKVLEAWTNQMGPDVRLELEPIRRMRSAPMVRPMTPAREGRKRRRKQELPAVDVPLLPEGGDYELLPDRDLATETQDQEHADKEYELLPAHADKESLKDFRHPKKSLETEVMRESQRRQRLRFPRSIHEM